MTLPLYYNWRNLWARKVSSALTFAVVAVVVLVLAVLLAFATGMRRSLVATGHSANIIVLKAGATAESTSVILPEESARVVQTPGVARDERGELIISSEICVQATLPRRDGSAANVAVRGVDEKALRVHEEVRLTAGRWFREGALEAVVGRAALARFAGLDIGSKVVLGRFANREYVIVGTFEARGGALESEIWATRNTLADSYERRFASSLVLRLEDAALADAAVAYLNGPAVQLEARRETEYYEELSSRTAEIVALATILVGIMAAGAAFAVANTLYAAVDGRRREIAMLRTIGFSRAAIYLAIVVEAGILCGSAAVAGLAVSLLVHGQPADYLSDLTYTVLAYEMTMTPQVAGAALAAALLVGVCGALAPAVRAARTRVIDALRKA